MVYIAKHFVIRLVQSSFEYHTSKTDQGQNVIFSNKRCEIYCANLLLWAK